MPAPLTPLARWPGPATTGVPAAARLTSSGPLDLKRDGEVVTDLHVTGYVNVYARDVVIRRTKITCAGGPFAIRTLGSAVNLLVEDVEIDGRGWASAAVHLDDYTLRRVDIHHVRDGVRLGSRTVVVDSWIHDLVPAPGSHNDCLRVSDATDVVVRHNRLDAYQPDTGEPLNSCLLLDGAVHNLRFEENYCDGGAYSVTIRPELVASNVVIRGNVFGRRYRLGAVSRPGHPGVHWADSNVWCDDGRPVA
ncbi:hypothetical protein [Micromonospora sp. HM5-17]|jgi:hypothetical protein|uniref:hypothetical protein n=1 Tax=Micromonospora sp. HM5-17 TaxID=2487710 RepID=UPI000F473778|nr:hypothetical protein [Micromonospora sp. HM5-17]ROT33282.1 hypothetical protein EF879_09330 [Micromonospora sp. HM5-17]